VGKDARWGLLAAEVEAAPEDSEKIRRPPAAAAELVDDPPPSALSSAAASKPISLAAIASFKNVKGFKHSAAVKLPNITLIAKSRAGKGQFAAKGTTAVEEADGESVATTIAKAISVHDRNDGRIDCCDPAPTLAAAAAATASAYHEAPAATGGKTIKCARAEVHLSRMATRDASASFWPGEMVMGRSWCDKTPPLDGAAAVALAVVGDERPPAVARGPPAAVVVVAFSFAS